MTIAMRTDDPYEHTRGACDLQIHAGPDLFKRIGDDEDIAIAARNAGMDAICIKGHALNTARSAYFASKHVPGIHIFGGVVLNWSVGGIEPSAAIASFEVGGKAVWLPTYDAQYHAEIFGMTGSYATHEIPKEKMLAEGHGGSHLDFVIKGAGTKPGISSFKMENSPKRRSRLSRWSRNTTASWAPVAFLRPKLALLSNTSGRLVA
jgi:hypothetical protein